MDWTEAHLMRLPLLFAKHIVKDEYTNRLSKPFHILKLDCGTRFSPQKLLHETDIKEFSYQIAFRDRIKEVRFPEKGGKVMR